MQPGQQLVSRISAYNPDFDLKKVEIACEYAKTMHDGQTRASGEPYYTHPIEVASILADDPSPRMTRASRRKISASFFSRCRGHPRPAGQAGRPLHNMRTRSRHQAREAQAHRAARRWRSTRRWPSASACTR
jgi:hypothetical protein